MSSFPKIYQSYFHSILPSHICISQGVLSFSIIYRIVRPEFLELFVTVEVKSVELVLENVILLLQIKNFCVGLILQQSFMSSQLSLLISFFEIITGSWDKWSFYFAM